MSKVTKNAPLSLVQEKTNDNNQFLMTRKETANLFKISTVTLYRWVKAGKIPVHAIGGRIYFKRDEVINSLVKLNH